jgi:hypothetical protein
MRALCLSVVLAGLAPLLSCIGNDPTASERWSEIKRRANYADYCDMEICDQIEQGQEPPCDCWCDYDGDDDGDTSGDGDTGGDDGSGGDCDTGNDDVCGGGDDGSTGGDDGSTGGDDGSGGGDDTGDDGSGGDDDGVVEGCTLTQGYWKTHNEFASNRGLAVDWPAPYDELDQMCGQSLLDIFNVAPKGDAWYILAHQYIAASLNAASGASTDSIGAELDEAGDLLAASCGGVTDRDRALELAELLDAYNNGLLGPEHCGD